MLHCHRPYKPNKWREAKELYQNYVVFYKIKIYIIRNLDTVKISMWLLENWHGLLHE